MKNFGFIDVKDMNRTVTMFHKKVVVVNHLFSIIQKSQFKRANSKASGVTTKKRIDFSFEPKSLYKKMVVFNTWVLESIDHCVLCFFWPTLLFC